MNRSWGSFGMFACALALAGCAGSASVGDNHDALTAKLATGSFHLLGVTSDNYAIVQNSVANTINAVNLASGASTLIVAGTQAPGTDWLTFGQTAIVLTDAIAGGSARMTVWTAATGAKLLSANADIAGLWNGLRVSRDGQRIAYWDHVDATTDALVVDNAQHSARRVLTNVAGNVHGVIRLPGGTGTRVVASYCTVGGTLAGGNGIVTAWNLATDTSVTLQTNAQLGVQVDPSGTRAMVRQQGSIATIVTLDGATRVPLDSDFFGGIWLPDGVEFVYVAGGALKRVCTSGKPEIIQSGVAGLYALSPDTSAVAYVTTQSDNGNSDLRISSLLAQQPPAILNADGAAHLENWSGDGKQFLFYDAADAVRYVGTLIASPVSGGPGRVLTTTGLSKIDGDLELSGQKLVFNDNWVPATPTVPEHVDLKYVDLSGAAAPATLASNVTPNFIASADERLVVYTTADGLYTVTLP